MLHRTVTLNFCAVPVYLKICEPCAAGMSMFRVATGERTLLPPHAARSAARRHAPTRLLRCFMTRPFRKTAKRLRAQTRLPHLASVSTPGCHGPRLEAGTSIVLRLNLKQSSQCFPMPLVRHKPSTSHLRTVRYAGAHSRGDHTHRQPLQLLQMSRRKSTPSSDPSSRHAAAALRC